jgi:dynein heavy chain
MNTVLVQELIRYNKLLSVMATDLVAVKLALKGFVVMSEELEYLAKSLRDNYVNFIYTNYINIFFYKIN